MSPHDPADQTRTLYRENLWLRELLVRVAQDLEHVAVLDRYRPHTDRLRRRAQRVRQRLHDGVPEGWRAER